jgi:glycine/D-amino acid oxidase-like deaminating enzyme
VVVVGAGVVGSAIADRMATAGATVCLLERFSPAAGSSSSGEGNILVSDKLPGPDLELALRGARLWRELAEEAGAAFEFEAKGGLVVAHDDEQLAALYDLAAAQRAGGARVELLSPDELTAVEPLLAGHFAGGAFYPDDSQVQPMQAVAYHVASARRRGCLVAGETEVLGCRRDAGGRIVALETTRGEIGVSCAVINAAGPWSGLLAERLGSSLPVVPRRGHILVTEPVPMLTPHKVYEADYVGAIHDEGKSWSCSSVVESTASGTMLLGSSREFAGWSTTVDHRIVAAIASRAVALFPVLADVRLMRIYVGFRPATPDRLPAIGWDRTVGALLHATGHEGAGIGLAQATAEAVECLVLEREPPVDLGPFRPDRFGGAGAGGESLAVGA